MASSDLVKAVAVTAELCGRSFSPEAARVFIEDLAQYPEHQVFGSLKRCRKEVRGALTVQDVVSRLDDGRPGAEEAWAGLPMTEGDTAVWTAEMAQAFGVALPLIDAGEVVAARMAFKETYARLIGQARDAGQPVNWSVTLGHNPAGRPGPLARAVELGRITHEEARSHCPALPAPSPEVVALLAGIGGGK